MRKDMKPEEPLRNEESASERITQPDGPPHDAAENPVRTEIQHRTFPDKSRKPLRSDAHHDEFEIDGE